MDRNEVETRYKAFLKEYALSCNDVLLGAGGACVMHRVREETSDLDLSISQAEYDRIRATGCPTKVYGDKIHLTPQPWLDICVSTEPIASVTLDGVMVYTVNEVLKQKVRFNRDKDQRDITRLCRLVLSSDIMRALETHMTSVIRNAVTDAVEELSVGKTHYIDRTNHLFEVRPHNDEEIWFKLDYTYYNKSAIMFSVMHHSLCLFDGYFTLTDENRAVYDTLAILPNGIFLFASDDNRDWENFWLRGNQHRNHERS